MEKVGGHERCLQIAPEALLSPYLKSAGGLGNCCAFHTLRGVVSPHPVPSWAASGTQELCQGWGGVRGGGLQPFGVSFIPSLCSCAWICAWSQDIWVLSEQLTLVSAASPCLSFPPCCPGEDGAAGGGLGFATWS